RRLANALNLRCPDNLRMARFVHDTILPQQVRKNPTRLEVLCLESSLSNALGHSGTCSCERPSRLSAMPALSGHNGRHDTNLRQFAAEGITLAGRLTGADGERLTFAGDLALSLARTDDFFEERVRGIIDCYIDRVGIEAPPAEYRTIRSEPPEL